MTLDWLAQLRANARLAGNGPRWPKAGGALLAMAFGLLAAPLAAQGLMPASGPEAATSPGTRAAHLECSTAAPVRQVSLSASASQELVEDELSVELNKVIQGRSPQEVQSELAQASRDALRVLADCVAPVAAQASSHACAVHVGQLAVTPRYKDAHLVGWEGHLDVSVRGQDTARVAAVPGQLPDWAVGHMAYELSAAARERAETQLQAQAIASFQAQAMATSQAFGFHGVEWCAINLAPTGGMSAAWPTPLLRANASMGSAAASEPSVAVLPGTRTITVSISGTIEMRP